MADHRRCVVVLGLALALEPGFTQTIVAAHTAADQPPTRRHS
jgi:hypothetical protein